MMPKFLTKDVGPLPIWGWGVASMAGIGVGMVLRRSSLFSSGITNEADTGGDMVRLVGRVDPATAVVANGTSGGVSNVTNSTVTTNNQWRSKAVTVAAASGVTAVDADIAISNYLNGRALSQPQIAIVETVLRQLGLPPDPPNEITQTPNAPDAPDPNPGPVPPGQPVVHTVSKGESLSSISKQYYGTTSLWRKIYNANKAVVGGNPNRIFPGQTLAIPPK